VAQNPQRLLVRLLAEPGVFPGAIALSLKT
jgi:hypothetical protein